MKFNWFRRKQRDEELDAEIRSHLDEAICDRIERGESPDEARAHALRVPIAARRWCRDWPDRVNRADARCRAIAVAIRRFGGRWRRPDARHSVDVWPPGTDH